MRLLGTGRPRANEIREGLHAIRSVSQTRQANAKQMELSLAAHVEGLGSTLSDT